MAGILDKKTRFMDTFLTDRGRQELAKGELRFSFATFSDYGTFYESTLADPSVAEDATKRIYFESHNRPQDLVIPEFDSDGGMFFPAGGFDIVNGQLKTISGSAASVKGDKLALSASAAISDSLNSFVDMRPLRSEEPVAKTSGFSISTNSKDFIINSSKPIPKGKPNEMLLDNAESLWQDKKLAHVLNFQHLPPVNMTSEQPLKVYPKLQQPMPISYDDLRVELDGTASGQWSGVGDPAEITFDNTSTSNNLVCQVWEVTSSSIEKLRMIDFGEFEDADPFSPGKHIFFVGKVFDDDEGDTTFINLFTVVFD